MPFDRLSHVSALRPRAGAASPAADETSREPRHLRLARLLGAETRATPRGQHLAVTSRFPGTPARPMGDRALHLLAPHAGPEIADPRGWILLDTETTGLAGGTGTYAFLVGVAWWEEDNFVVEQLFMRDHSEEASLLHDLSRRLDGKSVLVTFNGKSFDWPLLETRYRMTRTAGGDRPAFHLDLLHPARQLWRLRLKSVALGELERHILGLDRGPDIPSNLIPRIYFDFLRGGPEGPIGAVFRHNLWDLRGLAALAGRILDLLEEPEAHGGDAGELFGISRMLHRHGEQQLAERSYQLALTCGLPDPADRFARRELALMARRQGDFQRANTLWEELRGCTHDGLQAYEQLAIHYEHRARDPRRALALTREALDRLQEAKRVGLLSSHQFRRWEAAFEGRLKRLASRVERRASSV